MMWMQRVTLPRVVSLRLGAIPRSDKPMATSRIPGTAPRKTLGKRARLQRRLLGCPRRPHCPTPGRCQAFFWSMFASTWKMNFLAVIISFLFSLALVLCVAFLYYKFKEDPIPEGGANSVGPPGEWRHSFCGCFAASPLIWCLACCCPAVRWADTMRMAGIFSFWPAVLIFASLYLLGPPTACLTALILLCLLVWKRQQLRERFNIDPGCKTGCLDCCAYICCACCAIVQEAQELEEAYKANDPKLQGRHPLR